VREQTIAALVDETRLPETLVRTVYEHEFARLRPGARVKDYLLVFTMAMRGHANGAAAPEAQR
jgi:hypothetical protein